MLIPWLHSFFKVCTCMNFTIIHHVGVNSQIKYDREIVIIGKTKRTMTDVNTSNNDGICRISVHNTENVPSTERFRGLPDPYVKIIYHGSFIILFLYGIHSFICLSFLFFVLLNSL